MTAIGKMIAGTLEIDFGAYRLLREGKAVRLTRTEWALLGELAQHPNQVLSHRTLLQRVWGTEYGSESDYVHTYISRLRRKVESDPSDPQYILTEPGVGYLFQKDISRPMIAAPSNITHAEAPRVINPFPLVVSPYYVGRQAEQQDIQRLLLDKTPLISVYGRAGVGKTALVCKVLMSPDLQAKFDGLVLLSANSTGISLPRILSDFYRLLNIDTPNQDNRPDPRRQITELLELLNQGDYILLLDNLETYQDSSGALQVSDLELFLTMALQQGGALRILLTGREPLLLPRPLKMRERAVMLEEGLSKEDSILLLRQCDTDNAAGLRDAPESQLAIIADRTRGFPRVLEAVVGLLLDDALLTLESLLNDKALFSDEMNEILVHSALSRLDDDSRRLMELIAAFKRPVTLDDLSQIAVPFMDTSALRSILNRLVKAFFLKYQDEHLSAHPIDIEYCAATMPDLPDYSRQIVHRHIAAFYRNQQPANGMIASLQDLELYQNEIEHLLDAGDADAAARCLLRIDESYMSRQGHYTELVQRYESLTDKVQDTVLRGDVLWRRGEAYRAGGRVSDALGCYEKALELADSEIRQAKILNSLGWAHYDLGKYEVARDYWEQAGQLFQQTSDETGTAIVYGGTGWVSYLLGDTRRAEIDFENALEIFRRHENQWGIAVNQGDLGIVQMAQGNLDRAIEQLNAALNLADENQFIREISYKAAYLAVAYLLSDELNLADKTIRMSTQYSEISVNQPLSLAIHGMILARLNRLDEALALFRQSITAADSVLSMTVGLYQVVYARGLAKAGMALLNEEDIQSAYSDYERALVICAESGVKQWNLRLLDALMKATHAERLFPLKVLLQG